MQKINRNRKILIFLSKKGFGNALSRGLSEIQDSKSGILVITVQIYLLVSQI